ncbi:hypothetical protein PHLGIDRAFT_117103 [Phlebiopsis gigantea 11061_1 CR5-6]|uniref:Uncharacterized protein n=1 Tax=Phlebiopsis gigantea (strain 11061_1 CR5-6) TaxID=745531 RepID=A0A0C3S9T4_PHLG1|nr:hypothetical protein PHLGIDRAFT_117103 [Phlebiopsis gigantea 11061_1 CR5-6]
MDIAFDTTWCPVCSRQILPKRIQVPIQPPSEQPQPPQQPPATTPAPPPTTPTAPPRAPLTRNKTGTIRARAGLVHGTGRVKPNGTIRRSPLQKSTTATALAKQQQQEADAATAVPPPSPTTPTPPVRHRTIIDQTPVPLYCSDECRLADLQSSAGIDINYRPDRTEVERAFSPTIPPVPHNSFVGGSTGSNSSVESGSSVESSAGMIHVAITAAAASPSSKDDTASTKKSLEDYPYPLPRGYARLASIYDLPPPPPPLMRSSTVSSTASKTSTSSILTIDSLEPEDRRNDEYAYERPEDYCSGVMMAAKRIKEAVERPKEKKRPTWSTPSAVLSTTYALNATAQVNRVIPGWTDGSDRWRASVYSLSAPTSQRSGRAMTLDEEEERIRDVYSNKGGVATPLRSRGVYSTVGESSAQPAGSSSASVSSASTGAVRGASKPGRARSEAEELYAKFDMSFSRRTEARLARSHTAGTVLPAHHHHGSHLHHLASPTGSTHSLPPLSASAPVRKREVSILKKGAEGRLLVPDVKLKRTDSSASFAASASMSVVGEECEQCLEECAGRCAAATPRRMERRGSEVSVGSSVETESASSASASVVGSGRGRPSQTEAPHWNYNSSQLLYPILNIRKTEKKIVREAGPDGVMREVEVEVVVPRKRLFMFPGAGRKD